MYDIKSFKFRELGKTHERLSASHIQSKLTLREKEPTLVVLCTPSIQPSQQFLKADIVKIGEVGKHDLLTVPRVGSRGLG